MYLEVISAIRFEVSVYHKPTDLNSTVVTLLAIRSTTSRKATVVPRTTWSAIPPVGTSLGGTGRTI